MTSYEKIIDLLGPDAFLVPCAWGTKKPLVKYVGRSFASTRDPRYLAHFTPETNIAVYLGAASGGLCAIDFDADQDLAAFLALNPKLARTTRSRGSRGGMLWPRIKGDYPESCNPDHKHFEWRANRRLSTIFGRHPNGMDYQLLCDEPPLQLPFSEIIWPPDWPLPWQPSPLALLEAELGPPFAVGPKGAIKVNHGFIVGKLLREHDVLYDDRTARFYQYQPANGLWVHLSEVRVQHLFDREFRRLVAELKANSDNDARFDNLYFGINQSFLRSLTDMLKGAAARTGVFSKPNRVLHAANGMVDLNERPFGFKPFGKHFYSRNQSPILYDPAATCPRFVNELLRPALDPDDITLLQNWCGLSLLGRNTPQVMLILSGTAGGGKGTTVNIIHGIIGETNIQELRTSHLDSRFETAFFHDKTLLCGSDAEPNFLNTPAAHRLKALTGNDLVTTEFKGSSIAQAIRGDFNVLVTSNSRLMVKLQGDAEAWARRLLWIDFNKPRPEKIIHNFDRVLLREEGPGILNWMIEGAVRLLEVMDNNQPFPLTPVQRERVNSLLSESDAARNFILTCVERSPFPLDCVTSAELFTAYLAFCDERGWTPLSQRGFEMKAKDLMVQIHRACPTNKINRANHVGGQRGFQGVILKTAFEPPIDPQPKDADAAVW